MKVVFAGPSIHGVDIDWSGLRRQPPAAFGDIARAVDEGANSIGLIDGYFGWTPSVWHKEILYALSRNVSVFGASSLGALRAAECRQFGMTPVGQIAAWYCDGILEDDGDVALLHYPEELDFAPYTEALVDARATLECLLAHELVSREEFDALWLSAHNLNFQDRTIGAMVETALKSPRASKVEQTYVERRISLKTQDALTLLSIMRAGIGYPSSTPAWTFRQSFPWRNASI